MLLASFKLKAHLSAFIFLLEKSGHFDFWSKMQANQEAALIAQSVCRVFFIFH
jgi:hypothetical protein